MDITPKQLYLIEQLLSISSDDTYAAHVISDRRQRLFDQCKDVLRAVIKNASEVGHESFIDIWGSVYRNDSQLYELVRKSPDVVESAMNLYRKELDNILYEALLDKPLSEMTGYEYSLLAKNILLKNRHLFRPR